jgi:hydrogenase nickel incorporation protein HypA/HybF
MHELAIAENLIRQLRGVLTREKLIRVRTVALKVGVLRQIVPETLREAFSLLADSTPVRGAKLRIDTVGVRVRCRDCGKEAEGFIAACPSCRSGNIDIVAGKELFIDFIDGDRK